MKWGAIDIYIDNDALNISVFKYCQQQAEMWKRIHYK